MTVYVDNARGRLQYGRRVMVMCHMGADTPEELHAMAEAIGMKLKWFQGDHYDVSLTRRAHAVKLGAVEITVREMVTKIRRRR